MRRLKEEEEKGPANNMEAKLSRAKSSANGAQVVDISLRLSHTQQKRKASPAAEEPSQTLQYPYIGSN